MSRRHRSCLAALTLVATSLAVVLPAGSAAADPVTVTGTLTTNLGTPFDHGHVEIEDADQNTVAQGGINPAGGYSVQVEPGTYRFTFFGSLDDDETEYAHLTLSDVNVTGPMTLDASSPETALLVHVEDEAGQPVTAQVHLRCAEYDVGTEVFVRELSSRANGPTATVYGFPVEPENFPHSGRDNGCWLVVHAAGQAGLLTYPDLGTDTEVTVVVPDPATVSGTVMVGGGPATYTRIGVWDSRRQVGLLVEVDFVGSEYA